MRPAVAGRKLGCDSCAGALNGLDAEFPADHFQPLSHAEQSQATASLAAHQAFHFKAFAVILYFHANQDL